MLVLICSLWCGTLKNDNDGSTLLVAFIGSSFQEAAGGDSNTKKVSELMLLYSDREHTGYK